MGEDNAVGFVSLRIKRGALLAAHLPEFAPIWFLVRDCVLIGVSLLPPSVRYAPSNFTSCHRFGFNDRKP
jgi:hypothetical protein